MIQTPQEVKNASRVAFGLFEADLRSGELHKSGNRVRLQALPFKVLTVLLEHAGQIVTREELQMRVWGPNVVVDFEHSLSNAVKKLREALGDAADNPRFIETLSRRGFRFIAPVTLVDDAVGEVTAKSAPAALSAPQQLPKEVTWTLDATPVEASPAVRLHGKSLPFFAFGVGALLAGCAVQAWHAQRTQLPNPRLSQITQEGKLYTPTDNLLGLISGFVTDGTHVFAPLQENGQILLSQISLATGAADVLPLLSQIRSPQVLDISSDGTKLLIRSNVTSSTQQPLWVVTTDGASAFRVGNVVAQDAVWMPDGRSVLYASENQLSIVSTDDGRSNHFATVAGRAFWPRWSPDGKQVRFTIVDAVNHTSSLWEVSNDQRVAHPILKNRDNAVRQCCGVWTADSRFFVYEQMKDGISDLWETSSSLRASPLRITNGPLNYRAPAPGRKGSQVFFVGQDFHSLLERYDSQRREFVLQRGFLNGADHIKFSSDGAWVSWVDQNSRLYRARIDGSDRLLLTPAPMRVYMSNWSPDGTQVAFMGREPQKPWQIYMVNANGGPPVRLLEENTNIGDPFFSSDGKYLVFGSVGEFIGDPKMRSIHILDLATHRVTQLSQSLGLFSPAWSPDGRFIAAITTDQGKVMLYDTRTSVWKLLAVTSAAWPIWSNDSKALYVHAYQAENAPILRVTVADGRIDTVADLKSFRADSLAHATFAGLTPDNVPLMHAEIASGNLYSLDLGQR